MKYSHIISIIIISLIIGSCNNSELEKQNDAVYKSIKKIYTLNADGSIKYQYQHELKYITHFSFNRLFGESFIVYNPLFQELKINRAETKMADGKIVPSPDNAFNKVLPRFANGVPAFNHLREMVVTHTALEPGCTVNFDYELNSKADYLPFFNESIVLQEIVPVENLEIIVNVPQNTGLNYKLVNIDNQCNITDKDGYTQYKWSFKNPGSLKHEANQPHDMAFMPRLIFSSVDVPEAIKNLYSDSDLILSNDIKTTLRKRIFGIKNSVGIIREFQKIVGNELNDFNVPVEYSGYKIRPLNEVWNSNGGNSIEKAFLLNEFIKYIGFESRVIMAVSPVFYDKNVGCLKDFGHFYVLAKIDGEDIILSTNPTQANNLSFELKDAGILDLEGKSINLPDYVYDVESLLAATGNLEISNLGDLTGKVNLKVQGIKNPYLNYLENVENAKEIAASLFPAKVISDFNVIEFENTKSEAETKIEEKEIWKNQGGYYFVEVLSSNYGIKGEHLRTLLNERESPFDLSYPVNESYDFNITIPGGFNFVSPNINQELSNESGSVKIEISSADNIVHVIKSLKINKDEISPEEYSSFKNLLDIWNKKANNEIILKKVTQE